MSLKRILKRKVYKERGLPTDRPASLPLLKHKDYSKIAKEKNATKAKLKRLTRAAALRNPDEFYHKMEKSHIEKGVTVHNDTQRHYSEEERKHMAATDLNYTSAQRTREEKKIDKMKANLHFLGVPVARQHIVYVDDTEHKSSFDPVEYHNIHVHFKALERPYNVLPKEALKDSLHTPATVTKRESYQELQSRIKRVKKIKVVEAQLQASKQKMGNDKKNIVKTVTVNSIPVIKFKKQRNK